MIEGWELIPIAGVISGTVLIMTLIRGALRYVELRRLTPPAQADLAEMQARLTRIEEIVETTALEMERVAEANRFISKVLSERPVASIPPARTPERVITPH